MGRTRDELVPRLRSLPFGRCVIFYRALDDGAEIVRVLHGARDLRRAVALVADGQAGLVRVGRVGLRQLFTFGALGALVAQGWVHPVAVGVGLAALPPVLLCQGLLSAREDS